MDEKVCAACGRTNPVDANFCSQCRSEKFVQPPPESGEPVPGQPQITEGHALLISALRVILFSGLTSGVYVLYWLYRTWKQLQSETGETHYPFWHAATFFVPVYGLFRMHRHLSVIQELAGRKGIESLMPPGLGVTLMALFWLIIIVGGNQVDIWNVIVLVIVRLALVTTLMARAQMTLNAYWSALHGNRAARFPLWLGEARFLIAVLAIQLVLQLLLVRAAIAATA